MLLVVDSGQRQALSGLLKAAVTIHYDRVRYLKPREEELLVRRLSIPISTPPRLRLRLAGLEYLRIEGGTVATEEILPLSSLHKLPSIHAPTLHLFARKTGAVNSALIQSEPQNPIIDCAINIIARRIKSGPPVRAYDPACLVDRTLSQLLLEQSDWVNRTWGPAVSETHPVYARTLGIPTESHHSVPFQELPIVVLLPLYEFSRHDETEIFHFAPDEFILRSGSLLSALLRSSLGYGPLSRSPAAIPHYLGGHKARTNFDLGTLRYLIQARGIQSFVDLGCGPGGMVFAATRLGLQATGIDGDPSIPKHPAIIHHDFTEEPLQTPPIADLCWCVEFLEHLDEKYLPNCFPVLNNCRWLVATLAPPGQKGHHHVNCRSYEYWAEKLSTLGFLTEHDLTRQIRTRSTMRSNFMRDNGYVFARASG